MREMLKVKVRGFSMFPTIRPGEYVYIEPLEGEPKVGEILYFKDTCGRWILHRLVEKQVTKGDGPGGRVDILVDCQIAGCATFVERNGIKVPLEIKMPGWFSRLHAFIYGLCLSLRLKT